MSNTELIAKIRTSDQFTDQEKAEMIGLLNRRKKYGLVWEEKPEAVEQKLRDYHPVLKEMVERRIVATKPEPASTATKPTKTVAESKEAEQMTFDLVAEPSPEEAAPVVSQPETESLAPNHVLIEGDNLHALQVLSFTHQESIDVIYIDPPYNTGNKDFKYNDRFVDKEDSYRHSKWLSFMAKRLRIAKRLLKDSGVIFISIDENEYANLKILADEVFTEVNFVENIVWNKRVPKNDKGVGSIHEYVLLYTKSQNIKHIFTQRKIGIDDVLEFVLKLKRQNLALNEAEKALKKFYNKNGFDRGITLYSNFDRQYRLWGKINVSWPNSKTEGPRYIVKHPVTNKPCKQPDRGWRWKEETFNDLLGNEPLVELHDGSYRKGRIWFAKDEKTQPSSVKYLDEVESLLLRSIISTKSDGGVELADIAPNDIFQYPKPIDLLKILIDSLDNRDTRILDFFAGSGTTLHAAMQLNAEDGGSRQCILVTNNENNIAEKVCYERNKRVIQGYTNAKGEVVAGLSNNNLRYYQCDFVEQGTLQAQRRALVKHATDLLCIKEDCYQEVDLAKQGLSTTQSARLLTGAAHDMMVIYNEDYIEAAVALIKERDKMVAVYTFSPDDVPFTDEFEDVADRIRLCALPSAILEAYKRTLPSTWKDIEEESDVAQVDAEREELTGEEE